MNVLIIQQFNSVLWENIPGGNNLCCTLKEFFKGKGNFSKQYWMNLHKINNVTKLFVTKLIFRLGQVRKEIRSWQIGYYFFFMSIFLIWKRQQKKGRVLRNGMNGWKELVNPVRLVHIRTVSSKNWAPWVLLACFGQKFIVTLVKGMSISWPKVIASTINLERGNTGLSAKGS